MIPQEIEREHILSALKEIDREGYAPKHESTRWNLIYRGKTYPPKWTICIAGKYAIGKMHGTELFSGGPETNDFLESRGFQIEDKQWPHNRIEAFSWTVANKSVALKILDKSAFLYGGTGIPVEIRPFFLKEDMVQGERRPVSLLYDGKLYSAHIDKEGQDTARTRLFWNPDFAAILKETFPNHYQLYSQDQQPGSEIILRFERVSGYDSYKVSFAGPANAEAGTAWTDDELASVVEAYLWMLDQEKSRAPYSKAEVNEGLRAHKLALRSKASIEYRMQNISAVLEDLCLERIQGYLPAKNVGHGVRERLKKILSEKLGLDLADYEPTNDEGLLAKRVAKLRSKKMVGVPKGNTAPQKSTSNGTSFVRDPQVKAWVLNNAKGICEACGDPAPFTLEDLSPFLEVHHMIPLAEDGPDVVENAVAVCPNCHRRCHISSDRMTFIDNIYSKLSRLKK